MADHINLTSKTRLKTNPIANNSMCILRERKSLKIFIVHTKGVHIYDPYNQTFEEIKIGDMSGIASCLCRSDDLVFFCCGMRIYACGVNGKTLFEADTYLAVQKIEAVHVYGYQLWIVAGNMVNEFQIGGAQLSNKQSRITPSPNQKMEDVNSLIFDVKINHSLLIKLQTQKPFLLLLKNNNLIQIAEKKDPATFTTDSPPTYAYLYPTTNNQNRVLVGTMSGELLYLEIQRKKMKKLWNIKQNSKGRVNCIVEVKNGFIVFREGAYEMWNTGRQCLGRQQINTKIESAVYLNQEESFFYGTSDGQVVEMFDYEKMMKMAKERNQQTQRAKLINEIQALRKLKAELELKARQSGVPKDTSKNAKNVKITANLSLDYVKLCYSLEITSDRPIIKLIVRGNIQLLEDPDRIEFQGVEKDKIKTYNVRTDEKKLMTISLKYEEKYQEQDKLICMVMTAIEGRLVVSKHIVDLKFLSLHQKVGSKLLDPSSLKANVLRISGEFKYFLMNAWLNAIFNDLGSPSPQDGQYIELCYESIISKNKVYVQYRDKESFFYSQSPTPLAVIKKTIFQKSKQKNMSLSYDTKTNIEGLSNLLKKIAPKLKSFEKNRKEFQLLPGIQQIQTSELSSDLKQILNRSEQIKAKYIQTDREYAQLKNAVIQFYTSYRLLNNREVNQYQIEQLIKQLSDFNPDKIIKMIEN